MAFTWLASLLRNFFKRKREKRELDEEVRAQELLMAHQKLRAGMSLPEAHLRARLEVGGVEQVREEVREVRAGHLLESLFQDTGEPAS